MNREEIGQDVIEILRTAALSGSDREIKLDDSLGELGLGLDSLALIEFVTAIEKTFAIQMPDDIWTGRGQLTLAHFVGIIADSNSEATRTRVRQTEAAESVGADPPLHSSTGSAAEQSPNTKPRTLSKFQYIFNRLKVYYPSRLYYIVEFDLLEQPIPVYSPTLNLTLRTATIQDGPALTQFWGSFARVTFNREPMTLGLFQKLLETGHTCYAAWLDDRIVGYDWVWKNSYFDRYSGVRLAWHEDACYGGELWEHDHHKGEGIGLALLAFSLNESKKMGYARQITTVRSTNPAMLSASVQLFNFKITGSIRRRGVVPLSFSTWKRDGRSGYGRSLML